MTYVLTKVETTISTEGVEAPPRLARNHKGGAQSRTNCVVTFVLLGAFLILAMASDAQAQVFTKKQRWLSNGSPTTISLNYDAGLSSTGTIPIGTPVHIVYGIQVTSNNTSPTPVTLGITFSPPSGFNPTSVRCVKFPGGSSTGNPFTAGCNLPTAAIGALSASNDKVIVVIDGFFAQAGAFNVNFAATRGATTETAFVNMDANIGTFPVDIAVTKQVKPQIGGSFGSTATVAFGGTVKYKLTVKNLSAPDPVSHSTDVYLGKQLWLQDMAAVPGTNDVNIQVTAQNFQCTASLGAVCPAVPPSGSTTFALLGAGANNSDLLIKPNGLTYPTSSTGFLPAGGSFDIIFDAVITTGSQCSPSQNNKVFNSSYFTYSNGTTTISDTNPSNNTSSQTTVILTGLPTTCPPPPIQVTKTLLSPATSAWGVPFTYLITITNNSGQTLSGLGLNDVVSGNNTPAFTANFSYSSGTNPICSPVCISPLTSAAPLVGNQSTTVFQNSALFQPLAPGATQTLQYQVQYNATCSTSTGAGSITNIAVVTSGSTNVMGLVSTPMPSLPVCQLAAIKLQTSGPASFSAWSPPVTLGYQVQFKNNSPTQSVTVGTLIDAMALNSSAYASKLTIDYSYACTTTGVTMPTGAILNKPLTQADIQATNPLFAGVKLIDFSSPTGTVFAPNGAITCNLSVTLKQPPTDDSLCQGAGNPTLTNSVFMHLSPALNTNQTQPTISQQTVLPLPKCVSIVVGKTVAPSVVAGGPVTFTVTVKNAGNDHVSNIVLTDIVPPLFTNVTRKCLSGCTPLNTPVSVPNTFSVPLSPIGVGATVTVEITANAPTVLGSYCNKADGTFNPFPPLTYFEGNQAALTTAQACVQVMAPPPVKPTLKKKFIPSVINFGQPVKVSFTISNPAGAGAQSGLSFSDSLPAPPFTTGTVFSNTCGGTASVSGSVVTLQNGSLPAGPSTCTVVFSMNPPTKCGTFKNTGKNIVNSTGLNAAELSANLTVNCGEPVDGDLTKVVLGVPASFAGTFNFSLACTPPGGTPVTTPMAITFTTADPVVPYKSTTAKIRTIQLPLLMPGSTCTLTEVMPLPPPPPSCTWQTPIYSPTNGNFTVVASTSPKITVFNQWKCITAAVPVLELAAPQGERRKLWQRRAALRFVTGKGRKN